MKNKVITHNQAIVRVVTGLLASSVLLLAGGTVGLAQTGEIKPLDDLKPIDNRDPFSGSGTGAGLFDLIHRANLGATRSTEEFRAGQRQQLNDAAAEFRNRQLQLIRPTNQSAGQPATGTVAPAAVSTPAAAPNQ